jgi:hypothetical protein
VTATRTVADLALTDGLPAVFYGLPRPACWALMAIASLQAPMFTPLGRRLLVGGAAVAMVNSMIFVFINAGYDVGFGQTFAEIASTPALVAFTIGAVIEMIRLAGLRIGHG